MLFPDKNSPFFTAANTAKPRCGWQPPGTALLLHLLLLLLLILSLGCRDSGDRQQQTLSDNAQPQTLQDERQQQTLQGNRQPQTWQDDKQPQAWHGNGQPQTWQIEPGPDESSRIVRDMLGRTVSIPNEVTRVIGLRAGALRMLAYLDAVDLVAGVEEPEHRSDRPYLNAFPELQLAPAIGPLMGGDPELLVAARPDLIFMTFTTRSQANALQSRTNIPVIALEYGDFSDNIGLFFESLRLMGAVINRSERADTLITGIKESMDDLVERTSAIPPDNRPRVYIGGVSYRGARGITSTEPFYPPFRLVHARNVAQAIDPRLVNPIQGTYIDKEQLVIWNPEVLFLDLSSLHTAGPEIGAGTPLAATLEAVRNGRIYGLLPYNSYAANYEAILANAWYAGHVLYPELFEDQMLSDQLSRIFTLFLGKNIYDETSASHGGGFRRLDPGAL